MLQRSKHRSPERQLQARITFSSGNQQLHRSFTGNVAAPRQNVTGIVRIANGRHRFQHGAGARTNLDIPGLSTLQHFSAANTFRPPHGKRGSVNLNVEFQQCRQTSEPLDTTAAVTSQSARYVDRGRAGKRCKAPERRRIDDTESALRDEQSVGGLLTNSPISADGLIHNR